MKAATHRLADEPVVLPASNLPPRSQSDSATATAPGGPVAVDPVAVDPVAADPVPEDPTSLDASSVSSSSTAGAGLPAGVDLLARLEGIVAGRGLDHLAERLEDLASFVGLDMATFETEFARLPRRDELVGRSAEHLLALGGKRLRPMLLTLAARSGGATIDAAVVDLAISIELVHSATLLHDDVVDVSDARRGAPTSRSVYGNAASIFAGDWLLIEALRRVERSGGSALLRDLFDLIEEMIFAESLQLENRGALRRITLSGRDTAARETYFRIVEGKTASVFRWATAAGATIGGLSDEARDGLSRYGEHLGVSFQAVDDLLDLTGDVRKTGKDLFGDLLEGKMTLPLILALERDAELRPIVETILAVPADQETDVTLLERVLDSLRVTEALADTLAIARERSAQAVAALDAVPAGRARRALETVAVSIVDRDL